MNRVIYLIRHAEPRVVAGRKAGLSTVGLRQAEALGRKLKGHIPNGTALTLVHAPVLRCQETAQVLGKNLAVKPEELPLRFENVHKLKIDDVQSKYTAYMHSFRLLGVESPKSYTKRLLAFTERNKHGITVVVGNEVNMRVVLQILGGNTYNTPVEHAACYRLVMRDDQKNASIERVA